MRVLSFFSTWAQMLRRNSARSDFAAPLRGIRIRSAWLMARTAASVSCSGSPQPIPIRKTVIMRMSGYWPFARRENQSPLWPKSRSFVLCNEVEEGARDAAAARAGLRDDRARCIAHRRQCRIGLTDDGGIVKFVPAQARARLISRDRRRKFGKAIAEVHPALRKA